MIYFSKCLKLSHTSYLSKVLKTADIKMKYFMIRASINFMITISIFFELSVINAMHDFSVWLRTDSCNIACQKFECNVLPILSKNNYPDNSI